MLTGVKHEKLNFLDEHSYAYRKSDITAKRISYKF